MKKIIKRAFYERDTVIVAEELLGKILVREIDGVRLAGIINETEAYKGTDPASHAFKGKTTRNKALFENVGRAYIYFSYGIHYCLNAVARDKKSLAGGVLIRGIKPLEGIDIMFKNCNIHDIKNLTNGPGKLTKALDITEELYGVDLTKKGPLYITEGIELKQSQIIATPRIGISKATENMWRFIISEI